MNIRKHINMTIACNMNIHEHINMTLACNMNIYEHINMTIYECSYIPPVAMSRVSKLIVFPFLKETVFSKVSTSVASISV